MTIHDDEPQPETIGFEPLPVRRRRKPWLRWFFTLAAALVVLLIGIGIGSGTKAAPKAEPAPTVTVFRPGAATTETVTDSPPPPAPGTRIGKWSGSGNQVTPAFTVPDDGNYIVTWAYHGNDDCSFGSCQGSNFAISNTGDGLGMGLPNDIAGSGSGSTEVTGGSGTDRFNVQATGHWTITVRSAG